MLADPILSNLRTVVAVQLLPVNGSVLMKVSYQHKFRFNGGQDMFNAVES